MLFSILLAGGMGKRMNSELPKVLHEIKDKPMICHVIDRAIDIGSYKVLIVVGKYREIIENTISQYYPESVLHQIEYIDQPEPLGSGNAIQCCVRFFEQNNISRNSRILILSGDVPLITHETLLDFMNYTPNSNCLMSYELDNPTGYGRLIIQDDVITKIIEEKDCSEEEKKIKSVNCGIYYLDVATCVDVVPLIRNINKANEYYLTDVIELAYPEKSFSKYLLPKEKYLEIANINTPQDLENVLSLL